MNVTVRLEYELAYYDSAVHRFNHYTTRTLPLIAGAQNSHELKIKIIIIDLARELKMVMMIPIVSASSVGAVEYTNCISVEE